MKKKVEKATKKEIYLLLLSNIKRFLAYVALYQTNKKKSNISQNPKSNN